MGFFPEHLFPAVTLLPGNLVNDDCVFVGIVQRKKKQLLPGNNGGNRKRYKL